jgi:hypothetical protein
MAETENNPSLKTEESKKEEKEKVSPPANQPSDAQGNLNFLFLSRFLVGKTICFVPNFGFNCVPTVFVSEWVSRPCHSR